MTYIPITIINNVEQQKMIGFWNDDGKKKVLFDKKSNNILASTLGIDDFFQISKCKTTKEIWTLEVTHEGTKKVKISKLNILSQEYKLFRMIPHECILDLQKIFTHLTNHLMDLEKTFTNDVLNLKVLRELSRAWQQKVMTISQKKSLFKMPLTALFEKL